MPRLTRLHSFLDRFEERLEVDCKQLKRQLLTLVDQQFGAVREKVTELRSRFGGIRPCTVNIDPWIDDPPVDTVPLDQCIREDSAAVNQPSTSTGRKREFSSASRTVKNKRQKTGTTSRSKKQKRKCKSPGCGKSFPDKANLSRHERIHLGIKPFSCTWPDCRYSAVLKGNVVQHVRVIHFKLPPVQSEQERLNIVDNRNPEDYIRVDNQLLERRLE